MTPEELKSFEEEARIWIIRKMEEEIDRLMEEKHPRGIINFGHTMRLDNLPDRGLYDRHNPLKQ